jgi:hypothetical protein
LSRFCEWNGTESTTMVEIPCNSGVIYTETAIIKDPYLVKNQG